MVSRLVPAARTQTADILGSGLSMIEMPADDKGEAMPVRRTVNDAGSYATGERLAAVLASLGDVQGMCICGEHLLYDGKCPTEGASCVVFESLREFAVWAGEYNHAFEWLSVVLVDEWTIKPGIARPFAEFHPKLWVDPPEFTFPGAHLEIHVFDFTKLVVIAEESLFERINHLVPAQA